MPKRKYDARSVHSELEALRYEMASGMGDEEVAKKTGYSPRTVQRWRLRNGVLKAKGAAAKQALDIYAISAFGEALGDVKQRTHQSAVKGAWEPPAFVTRAHIDYSQFLRLLDAGHRMLGMSDQELVAALGMTPLCIEQGLSLYYARLTEHRCQHCRAQLLTDSMFCSAHCKRQHGSPVRL